MEPCGQFQSVDGAAELGGCLGSWGTTQKPQNSAGGVSFTLLWRVA